MTAFSNPQSAIRNPQSSTTHHSPLTTHSLCLLAAMVVALLLRLHCLLCNRSLWLDEFVTLWSIGGGG